MLLLLSVPRRLSLGSPGRGGRLPVGAVLSLVPVLGQSLLGRGRAGARQSQSQRVLGSLQGRLQEELRQIPGKMEEIMEQLGAAELIRDVGVHKVSILEWRSGRSCSTLCYWQESLCVSGCRQSCFTDRYLLAFSSEPALPRFCFY